MREANSRDRSAAGYRLMRSGLLGSLGADGTKPSTTLLTGNPVKVGQRGNAFDDTCDLRAGSRLVLGIASLDRGLLHILVARGLFLITGLGDKTLLTEHGMGQCALSCAVAENIERAAGFGKARARDVGALAANSHHGFTLLLGLLDRG